MKLPRSIAKGRLGIIILALVALVLSPLSAQAGRPSESIPPSFSDGEWSAKFSIHAVAPFESMTLDAGYLGDMQFISSGGNLDGEWLMNGQGTYSGTVTGTANVAAGGKVAGSSAEPQVTTKNFIIDLNITVAGFPVSDQVDFGEGAQVGMILTNATCNQVTADIAAPAVANYQQAGVNAKVVGSFTAIRVGDLSASDVTSYMQEVSDLIDAAEVLKMNAVAQNGVDFNTLNELVTRAANLNLALKKNVVCGFGGNKSYLTVITDVIADLANFALDNPQLFTTEELSRLSFVAISVGAMGAGAVNPQTAANLQAGFVQEFGNRLDDAQNNNNCDDAVQILVTAGSLGDAGLKQQAQDVVASIC